MDIPPSTVGLRAGSPVDRSADRILGHRCRPIACVCRAGSSDIRDSGLSSPRTSSSHQRRVPEDQQHPHAGLDRGDQLPDALCRQARRSVRHLEQAGHGIHGVFRHHRPVDQQRGTGRLCAFVICRQGAHGARGCDGFGGLGTGSAGSGAALDGRRGGQCGPESRRAGVDVQQGEAITFASPSAKNYFSSAPRIRPKPKSSCGNNSLRKGSLPL